MRRYPAGLVIAAHSHPHATEIKFILSGRWEVGGQQYGPSDLLAFPRGELQGPHQAQGDRDMSCKSELQIESYGGNQAIV